MNVVESYDDCTCNITHDSASDTNAECEGCIRGGGGPALMCNGKVLSYCNYDGMSVDLSLSPNKHFAVTSAEGFHYIYHRSGEWDLYRCDCLENNDIYTCDCKLVIFDNHLLKLRVLNKKSYKSPYIINYEIYTISTSINLQIIDAGIIQVKNRWLYSEDMKQVIKQIAINTCIAKECDDINSSW